MRYDRQQRSSAIVLIIGTSLLFAQVLASSDQDVQQALQQEHCVDDLCSVYDWPLQFDWLDTNTNLNYMVDDSVSSAALFDSSQQYLIARRLVIEQRKIDPVDKKEVRNKVIVVDELIMSNLGNFIFRNVTILAKVAIIEQGGCFFECTIISEFVMLSVSSLTDAIIYAAYFMYDGTTTTNSLIVSNSAKLYAKEDSSVNIFTRNVCIFGETEFIGSITLKSNVFYFSSCSVSYCEKKTTFEENAFVGASLTLDCSAKFANNTIIAKQVLILTETTQNFVPYKNQIYAKAYDFREWSKSSNEALYNCSNGDLIGEINFLNSPDLSKNDETLKLSEERKTIEKVTHSILHITHTLENHFAKLDSFHLTDLTLLLQQESTTAQWSAANFWLSAPSILASLLPHIKVFNFQKADFGLKKHLTTSRTAFDVYFEAALQIKLSPLLKNLQQKLTTEYAFNFANISALKLNESNPICSNGGFRLHKALSISSLHNQTDFVARNQRGKDELLFAADEISVDCSDSTISLEGKILVAHTVHFICGYRPRHQDVRFYNLTLIAHKLRVTIFPYSLLVFNRTTMLVDHIQLEIGNPNQPYFSECVIISKTVSATRILSKTDTVLLSRLIVESCLVFSIRFDCSLDEVIFRESVLATERFHLECSSFAVEQYTVIVTLNATFKLIETPNSSKSGTKWEAISVYTKSVTFIDTNFELTLGKWYTDEIVTICGTHQALTFSLYEIYSSLELFSSTCKSSSRSEAKSQKNKLPKKQATTTKVLQGSINRNNVDAFRKETLGNLVKQLSEALWRNPQKYLSVISFWTNNEFNGRKVIIQNLTSIPKDMLEEVTKELLPCSHNNFKNTANTNNASADNFLQLPDAKVYLPFVFTQKAAEIKQLMALLDNLTAISRTSSAATPTVSANAVSDETVRVSTSSTSSSSSYEYKPATASLNSFYHSISEGVASTVETITIVPSRVNSITGRLANSVSTADHAGFQPVYTKPSAASVSNQPTVSLASDTTPSFKTESLFETSFRAVDNDKLTESSTTSSKMTAATPRTDSEETAHLTEAFNLTQASSTSTPLDFPVSQNMNAIVDASEVETSKTTEAEFKETASNSAGLTTFHSSKVILFTTDVVESLVSHVSQSKSTSDSAVSARSFDESTNKLNTQSHGSYEDARSNTLILSTTPAENKSKSSSSTNQTDSVSLLEHGTDPSSISTADTGLADAPDFVSSSNVQNADEFYAVTSEIVSSTLGAETTTVTSELVTETSTTTSSSSAKARRFIPARIRTNKKPFKQEWTDSPLLIVVPLTFFVFVTLIALGALVIAHLIHGGRRTMRMVLCKNEVLVNMTDLNAVLPEPCTTFGS